MLELRPYQHTGLAAIRAALAQKRRAPLYVLPTGGGKTVTYAAMAQGASLKGNNILILEHRKELLRQASVAVGSLGVRHRVIAPPDKVAEIRKAHVQRIGWPMVDHTANVAVASVQTLARRMDWLQLFKPRIIIIDEAHHALAGTWDRIIKACPDAVLVGVTATPCDPKAEGLGKVFDEMIIGPSMQELIDEGYLVPFRIVVPPRQADPSKVHRRGDDLDLDEQAEILDKPHITGSAVEHYTQLAPGRPAVVFCTRIKHAEHVAEAFRAAGWRFEVVHGDMDEDLRDKRINGLADGSLHGIVSVAIIEEGTDIPAAEVGIMLRYTDSLRLFLQQAGRLTRPIYAPGFDLSSREGRLDSIAASSKQYGLLIDHVGNVGVVTARGFEANHGSPADERVWSLKGKARHKKAANDNDITVRMMQCPKCYAALSPMPTCKYCGHVFAAAGEMPTEVSGTLVEITPEIAAAAEARKAQGKARTLAQLKAMGMSEARAQHVMAARLEKERLQNELRELARASMAAGSTYPVEQIRDMKPKQLRAEIERLRSELGHAQFMGAQQQMAVSV